MTSDQISEARQTFFGCVYRNAENSPAGIGRLFARKVADQKELTTEVVKLMESAFTVAMAESQDLRIQLEELRKELGECKGEYDRAVNRRDTLEAEKYALEDQVKGLQELMAQPQGEPVAHTMKSVMEAVDASRCYTVLTSNQCFSLAQSLNSQLARRTEQPAPVAVVQSCCGSCPAGCVVQASSDAGKARGV